MTTEKPSSPSPNNENTTALSEIEFTIQKLSAVRRQIAHMLCGDFPHSHSREALTHLDGVFKANQDRLKQKFPNQRTRRQAARKANYDIVSLNHALGFLLRSTNVRNAFEVYDPVLRLAQAFLGNDAKLVLSAEWEFSPFTYPAKYEKLPKFVFIGLPVSECSNPLILPLAGHELGHHAWRHCGADGRLSPVITQSVLDCYKDNWPRFRKIFSDIDVDRLETDMFARDIWTKSYTLALDQVEEIFCDCVGVATFGESFLYAFCYLLSPSLGGHRNIHYPNLEKRAAYLADTARNYKYKCPTGFTSLFSEREQSYLQQNAFIVEMADSAVEKCLEDTRTEALEIAEKTEETLPNHLKRDEVYDHFCKLMPSAGDASISDIINAGWKLYMDRSPWKDRGLSPQQSEAMLCDLIYKSFEVTEYKKRTSES